MSGLFCDTCGDDRRFCECAVKPNPEHDSLFQRFEQLERLISNIAGVGQASQRPNVAHPAFEALALVKLIRAQVLK